MTEVVLLQPKIALGPAVRLQWGAQFHSCAIYTEECNYFNLNLQTPFLSLI
jgi:hypothetical protein